MNFKIISFTFSDYKDNKLLEQCNENKRYSGLLWHSFPKDLFGVLSINRMTISLNECGGLGRGRKKNIFFLPFKLLKSRHLVSSQEKKFQGGIAD